MDLIDEINRKKRETGKSAPNWFNEKNETIAPLVLFANLVTTPANLVYTI